MPSSSQALSIAVVVTLTWAGLATGCGEPRDARWEAYPGLAQDGDLSDGGTVELWGSRAARDGGKPRPSRPPRDRDRTEVGDAGLADAAAADDAARVDTADDLDAAAAPSTPATTDGPADCEAGPTCHDASAFADAGPPPLEVTANFAPTTAVLPNPERGFYGWSGSDFVSAFDPGSVRAAFDEGQRLVLALVRLDAYRTTDLPEGFLTALGQRFDAVRALGMKTVLLFAYDFTAAGNDATATRIARHLEQLAPVLARHVDVIPYMRAGFIGAWGEWHSSSSGNSCGYNSGTTPCDVADANRRTVRDALLAHVPGAVQIAFRYPADLIRWYPDPTQQRRAGLHNDCFLAGPSDSGTYASQAQRDYAMARSSTMSFGGENCHNAEQPLRDSCDDILAEGRAYHLAWLNASDWSGFMSAWRSGGCHDEVSASMGYRLQLDAVTHAAVASPGSVVVVRVDLRNAGWARMFGQDRPLEVQLRPVAGGSPLAATSATALQELPAQAEATTRIEVSIAIPPSAATGVYEVHLAAPDPSPALADDGRFAVRFANDDAPARGQRWDATAATFRTGTTLLVE